MIVITGAELPSYLCQVKSFTKSLYNVSPELLMTFGETNKLDFARGAVEGIKSSHYGIYLSNVLRGIGSCDYEKEFDSIQRDSLWQILRAYDIPQRIVNIKFFYSNFTLCCVGQGDISFEVKTGVRKGFVMSSVLSRGFSLGDIQYCYRLGSSSHT